MPLINSSYQPTHPWLKSAHASTIYPALLRRIKGVEYEREVLELEDGDFLDLDWFLPEVGSDHLVIVLHGLEGAADRPYVKGACKYFAMF